MANPLLHLGDDLPFDAVAGEHVVPAADTLLAEAAGRLEALVTDARPRTFVSTMEGLEQVSERLGVAMGVVGHLEGVATTPALRDAYNDVQPKVSAFFTALLLNPRLYAALRAYAETEDARTLDPTRRRFVEKTLAEFRRQGAELGPEGKRRLAELDVELTRITVRYSQNVLDSTNAFELVVTDEAELAGLPESVVEAARAGAAAKGLGEGWRFTLQAPSYVPLVTYAASARLREAAWRAYNTRATSGETDNRPLVAKILELRRAKATLLGYKDFADLVLEERMAKSGQAAWDFCERLGRSTAPYFVAENQMLEAFRRDALGPDAGPMRPWDVTYWAEKQRVALYAFDEEELRPYFELGRVLDGLFSIARSLYGVRIEAWKDAPTWDPKVTAWRVVDGGGTRLASFYVDVFPRENKRDGAWMDGIVTGVHQPGRHVPHIEALVANVTPPVGDKPALLSHREVETMFHEFGHLMHHALSQVEVRSMAGTNVAWDFVELPSKIMENWCWDKAALRTFARHWQTNEPLPDDLLAKMQRAKNYRAANAMMRQLGFSVMDLALHMKWEPSTGGDVMAYARSLMATYSAVELPAEYGMIAGFSHLFSSPVGYAAGYYSYKWAEVLDADAFTFFQSEGLLDERAGGRFRAMILSKGDSKDPADLYRAFLGRDPDERALLARSGLLELTP